MSHRTPLLVVLILACSGAPTELRIPDVTFKDLEGYWLIDYSTVQTDTLTPQLFDTRAFPTCPDGPPPPSEPCVPRPFYFGLTSVGGSGLYSFASRTDGTQVTIQGNVAMHGDTLALSQESLGCCVGPAAYVIELYPTRLHLSRQRLLGPVDFHTYGFTFPVGVVYAPGHEDWWLLRP